MQTTNSRILLKKRNYDYNYNSHNTISVTLAGRIGNVLFQLAAAATLAQKHQSQLIAIPSTYKVAEPDNCSLYAYLHQFRYTILRNIDIRSSFAGVHYTYTEPFFHYTPIEYSPQMNINGYFQSEKHIDPPLVRRLFKIDGCTHSRLRQAYGEILNLPEITSINVRRGDYVRLQDQFTICPLSYYNKAIDLIGRDKPYLITSDDLDWCRANFTNGRFHFAAYTNPTYDLYLQSMCKHNIISNSTFSWWGAWLNENPKKIIIAPRQWFGPANAHLNTKDLIPDTWIKI